MRLRVENSRDEKIIVSTPVEEIRIPQESKKASKKILANFPVLVNYIQIEAKKLRPNSEEEETASQKKRRHFVKCKSGRYLL